MTDSTSNFCGRDVAWVWISYMRTQRTDFLACARLGPSGPISSHARDSDPADRVARIRETPTNGYTCQPDCSFKTSFRMQLETLGWTIFLWLNWLISSFAHAICVHSLLTVTTTLASVTTSHILLLHESWWNPSLVQKSTKKFFRIRKRYWYSKPTGGKLPI